MSLSDMVARLRGQWVTASEIRAETWSLGVRHRGEVAAGARSELKEPNLSPRRGVLLRAVIRRCAAKA